MTTDTELRATKLRATKLKEIIAAQEEIFVRRQPRSKLLAEQAKQHLAGGVTSSWQITAPQPVWLSHGRGAKVWDVDGNEYVDLHGGYGAALAGHAHPAIARAITEQARNGTHFAQPTPDAIAVATELARRFGLPRWRFANSGTEATMDAVHLMRSITGRDLIIKIEGCYHGHHDSVQVSVAPEPDEAGPENKPNSAPASTGIPSGHHRPDADRHLQRPGQRGAPPGRAQGPGRGDDHRAGHDERRDHQARARLPRRPQGPTARTPSPAHLRRGEDRPDRRPGRRDAKGERPARPHHPGQVAGRRRGRRGHRRHRRSHGPRGHRRLRDGGHLQREPAGHGRDPGYAHRGGHARGVREDREAPPARRQRHTNKPSTTTG